jgi:hypothetical protein
MRTALMLLAALPLFAQPSDITPPTKPDSLPATARQTVERYDKAAAEAKKMFDAAIAKAADAARKDLTKIQESETKSGRLEAAMAVKSQIDRLPNAESTAFEIPKFYLDLEERIEAGTMTATEWKGLPGTKFVVEASAVLDLTKIVLKKGDIYLIAPNPTDKWKGAANYVLVNYLGENGSRIGMRLQVKVGDAEMKAFMAEGEGVLSMRANDTMPADNGGSITVKIIRIR